MVRVFVSYRRSDSSAWAGRIASELKNRFTDPESVVYHDVGSVRLGEDYQARIMAEIEQCDALVAVIGPGWVGPTAGGRRIDAKDDQVRRELLLAKERGVGVVLPLLVDGASWPLLEPLPPVLQWLNDRQSARIHPDEAERDLGSAIDRLLEELGYQGPPQSQPPGPGVVTRTYIERIDAPNATFNF